MRAARPKRLPTGVGGYAGRRVLCAALLLPLLLTVAVVQGVACSEGHGDRPHEAAHQHLTIDAAASHEHVRASTSADLPGSGHPDAGHSAACCHGDADTVLAVVASTASSPRLSAGLDTPAAAPAVPPASGPASAAPRPLALGVSRT